MTTEQQGAGKPGELMSGQATARGTTRYRDRFAGKTASDHFRKAGEAWASSLGIGTYLGEPDERDDAGYTESVIAAVRSGCNVIDTAINYRFQRSERSIGVALKTLAGAGGEGEFFGRDEVVVASKGGFIPFDGAYPIDAAQWFRSALLAPGIANPDDVVANCHVMTPRYLEAQIEWSRRNLGLQTLDIYYLHNPEIQLQEVERPEFLMRVKAAFELLEKKVAVGAIGVYGVATWDGFRVPPNHPGHLSLKELLAMAHQAGGERHHFRAIQLPLNLVMGEACLEPTQAMGTGRATLLEAAASARMTVMASASLLQGQVIRALTPAFAERLPGTRTNAQRGLQIVRSVPGLTTALVGMKQTSHVAENMALASIPALDGTEALEILKSCRSR